MQQGHGGCSYPQSRPGDTRSRGATCGEGCNTGGCSTWGAFSPQQKGLGNPRAESDEEEALPRIVGGDKRIRGRRNGAHMEVSVAGPLWKEQARARPS